MMPQPDARLSTGTLVLPRQGPSVPQQGSSAPTPAIAPDRILLAAAATTTTRGIHTAPSRRSRHPRRRRRGRAGPRRSRRRRVHHRLLRQAQRGAGPRRPAAGLGRHAAGARQGRRQPRRLPGAGRPGRPRPGAAAPRPRPVRPRRHRPPADPVAARARLQRRQPLGPHQGSGPEGRLLALPIRGRGDRHRRDRRRPARRAQLGRRPYHRFPLLDVNTRHVGCAVSSRKASEPPAGPAPVGGSPNPGSAQRTPRKNSRTSPTRRSGASIAAKWPPRSNSVQCTMLLLRSP
jgi:hypothetical protein